MATLPEIERSAMQLADGERATLAAHLLKSLPAILQDEDDGVAEAIRRDSELDAGADSGMTLAEFRRAFES